jgi:hypothetical protein
MRTFGSHITFVEISWQYVFVPSVAISGYSVAWVIGCLYGWVSWFHRLQADSGKVLSDSQDGFLLHSSHLICLLIHQLIAFENYK